MERKVVIILCCGVAVKAWDCVLSSPVRVFLFILAVSAFAVVLLTGMWPEVSSVVFPRTVWGLYTKSFWENVLVEAHGLLMDVLVLGVFYVLIDTARQKRNKNEQDLNCVLDLAPLDGEEIARRKLRFLRQLQDRGVEKIDVKDLLFNSVDIKGYKFVNSGLYGLKIKSCRMWDVLFYSCSLHSSIFCCSRIKRCEFYGCNLKKADFSKANLRGAVIHDCNLSKVRFDDADLKGASLKNCDLQGACFKNANMNNVNLRGCTNINWEMVEKAKDYRYIKKD